MGAKRTAAGLVARWTARLLACCLVAASLALIAKPARAQDCQFTCLAACPKPPGAFGSSQFDPACAKKCLQLQCEPPGPGPKPPIIDGPHDSSAIELILQGAVPFRALSRGVFTVTAAALPVGGSFTWTIERGHDVAQLGAERGAGHGIFTMPQGGLRDASASERQIVPETPGRFDITVSYTVNGMSARQSASMDILPPLLFLHGIASDANTWNAMKERLTGAGLMFGGLLCATCAAPRPGDFYTANFQHAQESYIPQGAEASRFVAAIAALMPPQARANGSGVAIVAHSMGGLASRAYLQSGTYRGDVAALVTVGTPHRGSIASQVLNYTASDGTPPPFVNETLYRDYWRSLTDRITGAAVKSLIQIAVQRVGGVDLELSSEGVRELAVSTPDMQALDRNAAQTLPRKIRYVMVVGAMPAEIVQQLLSNALMSIPNAMERSNPTYHLLERFLGNTDGLVDTTSQNLNSLVPGLNAPVIRTEAVHCCWPGVYNGKPINETEQTDVVLRAMDQTGLFGRLSQTH